ncbi:MAG TPA: S1/P1 nuclease, partial [Lacipirellulaceae bacterium]|nr:S1/P1 nuclease [Lacipirellulaceae bacterium]
MNRRHNFLVASLLLALCCAPHIALAWNSPGHMIVALIAYDQLDPATKAKAVELLREHPRFSSHFQGEMPREIQRKGDREKDEWVFAHAATWPDQVRDAKGGVNHQDVTEFHRPWWHFIDEPIFLNDDERQQLQSQVRVNLRRDPPEDRDDKDMNILQAIKNSKRIVADKTESK